MVKRISLVILVFFAFISLSGELFAQTSRLKNAQALILKGAYSQAAGEYRKVLAGRRQGKIKSEAHYFLGLCLLKESRYNEARKNFNIILRRYPRSEFCDDASLGIADSYLLAQDFEQAVKKYEQFIRDFPRSELVTIARTQRQFCKQGKHFANSYFSVQLGCFAEKKNAEGLRNELIDGGHRAYILEQPGSGLYYVRVGKFSNRSEAEFLEQRLETEGYSTRICP